MKFLLDEDVAIEAARCLRQAGHEVALVAETLGTRTDDVDIWRHAVRTDAIVVTCNRQDFLALAGQAPETRVDCPEQPPDSARRVQPLAPLAGQRR